MEQIEGNGQTQHWFSGTVEMPDGAVFSYYNSSVESDEAAQAEVIAAYEAAQPLAQVAKEISEGAARDLGRTAKSLLEMAIARIDHETEVATFHQ